MEAYTALAAFYDKLMDDADYDRWAAYLNTLIGRKNARIYEAACGTGNIACRLMAFGHQVVASDSSAKMLSVASQKAREQGCPVTFVRQDMRDFCVGNKVNSVVCACDGPNYLDTEGLESFAASAFDALTQGGVLLFDLSTRAKLEALDGQVYFDDRDDVTCIWHNTYDKAACSLKMDVTLFAREGSLYAKHSETHLQYAHEVQSVIKVMQQAGFAAAEVFECFSHKTLREDSQRAQFICRKQT